MTDKALTKEEKNLLNFLLFPLADVPKGLSPMFYHTGSYEGDCRIKETALSLINKLEVNKR